jgi:hypothetical protein
MVSDKEPQTYGRKTRPKTKLVEITKDAVIVIQNWERNPSLRIRSLLLWDLNLLMTLQEK